MTDAKTYIGQFAATVRRMIAQSSEVAKQAAEPISDGKYTADKFVRSATQFMDIAALGMIEIAENAVAGPSAPAAPIFVTSDPYHAEKTRSQKHLRTLSFTTPLARAGTLDYISERRITFEGPAGTDEAKYPPPTLPPDATEFRFKVDTTDLPSGVYTGIVTVMLDDGSTQVGDPVQVVIAL